MDVLWESQILSILSQVLPLPFVGLVVVFAGSRQLTTRE
jgi:hypothetical protein